MYDSHDVEHGQRRAEISPNGLKPNDRRVQYALPEIVGDEFVGRREELAHLYRIIGRAPRRLAYSIALVARKGMGKTALMQRFFNLLFFDRETGVAPIYLSLAEYRPERRPDQITPKLTIRQFCELYIKTFVRHWLAYYTENVDLVRQEELTLVQLAALAGEHGQEDLATGARELARQFADGEYELNAVLKWPSWRAYSWDKAFVYMIDEFQVTHGIYTDDKQTVTTIKENFQPVAEAKWAPLLVSGSIVSLVTEVVMSGLLARRFAPFYLEALPPAEAQSLIDLLSQLYEVPVSAEVADAILTRLGGHPFYIWAIFNSFADPTTLTSLTAFEHVLQFEMQDRQGRLQGYWVKNFQEHLARVNSEGLGEAILYWIASGEIEGEATPYKLVPLLQANKFAQVSEREVAQKMRELYDIDLLEKGLGLHGYKGLKDPVMTEFIRRNYYRDILRWSEREIADTWQQRYYELLGQTNYFKGRVAEGYVRELMRAFDGRTVDGTPYFGVTEPIHLPTFATVALRGGTLQDGRPIEIDVLGLPWERGHPDRAALDKASTKDQVWLVEVKYRTTPLDQEEAEAFLAKAAQVTEAHGYVVPTLWVVSKAGYTTPAEARLAEQGVLCSDVAQFNALASLLETLSLPT